MNYQQTQSAQRKARSAPPHGSATDPDGQPYIHDPESNRRAKWEISTPLASLTWRELIEEVRRRTSIDRELHRRCLRALDAEADAAAGFPLRANVREAAAWHELRCELRRRLATPPATGNSDTERLDWLESTQTAIGFNVEVAAWGVDFEAPYKPTIREAIDAAMKPNAALCHPADNAGGAHGKQSKNYEQES